MKKPKFTPGPWRIGNHSCIVECGSKDDTPSTYQKIEVQHLLFVPGETERAKANARLIKFAPDMYELLSSIADVIRKADESPYYALPPHIAGIAPAINELLNQLNTPT